SSNRSFSIKRIGLNRFAVGRCRLPLAVGQRRAQHHPEFSRPFRSLVFELFRGAYDGFPMIKWFTDAYTWIKNNDLPNTFTFVVTFVLWPIFLIWWNTRKVYSVSNLLVSFMEKPDPIAVNNMTSPAIDMWFENQTGAIVYITGPRIRNCSTRFPVSPR